MKYTLGEAAKATGKSKSTISKFIKNGTISAEKLENGRFQIDASELHRVFEKRSRTDKNEQKEIQSEHIEAVIKMARLEERLEASEKRNRELEDDRDKWRQQATALLENKVGNRSFLEKIFGKR